MELGGLRYRGPTNSLAQSADTAILGESSPGPAGSEDDVPKPRHSVLKYFDVFKGLFIWTSAVDARFDHRPVKKIEDYPQGYPRLAGWVNSDESFTVFRRFGTLRSRLILHRQFELVALENELDQLDYEDDKDDGSRRRLQSLRFDSKDSGSRRNELLDKIEMKLKNYDRLLQSECASLRLQKPTKRNYNSLVNYVWNRKPIVKSETEFLNTTHDFIMLAEDQDSRFSNFLEALLAKLLPSKHFFGRLFATKEQQERTTDEFVALVDKKRIELLIRMIVIIFSAITIVAPLILLIKYQESDVTKLIIVPVSVLVFAASISTFARPRNHELFVATATYTAVLVVFLDKAPTMLKN